MVENFFRFKNIFPINGILPAFIGTRVKEGRVNFMGDERTLLASLRDLDPQAITSIHGAYFPAVYRYAQYRLGDKTVAEDLASETFIRLLEALHAGQGPRTSLRGWLMATVSNLVNDYFRKVYNKPVTQLSETIPAQGGDPASQSEHSNQREILRLAMLKLTTDQQHVLALRFGSNSSLEETAEIMGKKANAIKQLQFRALAALRKHIEGEI